MALGTWSISRLNHLLDQETKSMTRSVTKSISWAYQLLDQRLNLLSFANFEFFLFHYSLIKPFLAKFHSKCISSHHVTTFTHQFSIFHLNQIQIKSSFNQVFIHSLIPYIDHDITIYTSINHKIML